ncbi:glycosyltransferase family 39 protein [Desulfovibrio sp. TomC]|uniref:glycosyltransferase family 39 protein n=1 Tax=Desulfovibrio sp. TomC TaxID=1562888 RepID=UPI000575BA79|nr:glycosyltransferase family 39 protein [Desulfovibrio sp. TomC]KHK00549.1 putative inner membrane protein [Desulfovibrio sp. TomC]
MRPYRIVSFLILGVAAFLIIHDLGTPSLWLDEVAAPLNAHLSTEAILELSRTLEEHPPLFYLLLKAFLNLGRTDFLVRLLPALAGLGCVAMVMAVGTRFFSRSVGLLAAALWLAMPQDLWLSRMARPYSLWLFFYLCALYFLAGFLKDGRLRSIWGLLASAAFMVATHYLSFPLLAAMGGCLLAIPPLARPRSRLPAIVCYAAGCAAITAAAYFGLIRTSATPALIAAADETAADAARAVGEALGGVLYLFDLPLARLLAGTAAGLGFFTLFRTDRRAFLLLAILTLAPIAILVVLGKATGLYARHLSSLGIPIALTMAAALGRLPRLAPRLPAITVAVLVLAALDPLVWHREQFYTVDSYQVPIIGNNYKLAAAGIARLYGPATVVSFGNAYYGNAVSWYLDQSPRPNAVDNPGLTPDDQTANLLFAAGAHWGYLAKDADDFEARFGPGAVRHRIETSTVMALAVPRDPVRRITALPARAGLSMGYRDFFATANIAKGVHHHQNARGPAIIPIHNQTEGQVRAAFALLAPPEPQDIRLNVLFDNTGQGNTLTAVVRFDDEPPTVHPLSTGYDPTHQRQIALQRDAPYAVMTVDLLLHGAGRTPTLSGGSQETLRLTGLEAFFCPTRDAAGCLKDAEGQLIANQLTNYLEERFAESADTPQATRITGRDNLAGIPDNVLGAWSAVAPALASRPGVMHLTLTTDRSRLSFFPRVGLDGMVQVWATRPDGQRRLLFALQNHTDNWTPISARYEFAVPDWLQNRETAVDLELTGRWSQLWTLGEGVFF